MEQVRIADILFRKYKQHRAKCRLNAQGGPGAMPLACAPTKKGTVKILAHFPTAP